MQQLQTPAQREARNPAALEDENQELESFTPGDIGPRTLKVNLGDTKPSFLSVLKNLIPGS